jgi:hypothetical protein
MVLSEIDDPAAIELLVEDLAGGSHYQAIGYEAVRDVEVYRFG